MPSNSKEDAIRNALTSSRLGTFESATKVTPTLTGALALYAWNTQVAAAMLAPLHICEVVIRNAVADAIASVYGAQWPWSSSFIRSLPNPPHGYQARQDLLTVSAGKTSVGKVIPELKFVFWQTLFTQRFDHRLWQPHLKTVLPYVDTAKSVPELRQLIYTELEQLRKLRNRIAHHEPIFQRNLIDDLQKAYELIAFRCPVTAQWMDGNQQAKQFIAIKPN
jgi:hypothetical protein